MIILAWNLSFLVLKEKSINHKDYEFFDDLIESVKSYIKFYKNIDLMKLLKIKHQTILRKKFIIMN